MANCAKTFGPGPGAYALPSLVGYPAHDPSRYRNPQYSMGGAVMRGYRGTGPGPMYNVYGMTRVGKASPPAYSLSSRHKSERYGATPGPGAYTIPDPIRNPAFSISPRTGGFLKSTTPGPNQYIQPSSIGPKVPHLNAAPAYSMIGKYGTTDKQRSPGPASYGMVPPEHYKPTSPKYSIPLKTQTTLRSHTPGPAAYMVKPPKQCSAGFSFGVRSCASPYVTADDEVPCVPPHRRF